MISEDKNQDMSCGLFNTSLHRSVKRAVARSLSSAQVLRIAQCEAEPRLTQVGDDDDDEQSQSPTYPSRQSCSRQSAQSPETQWGTSSGTKPIADISITPILFAAECAIAGDAVGDIVGNKANRRHIHHANPVRGRVRNRRRRSGGPLQTHSRRRSGMCASYSSHTRAHISLPALELMTTDCKSPGYNSSRRS